MKTLLLILFCLTLSTAHAQKKKKQDIDAIKAMCGCYEVSFNFAETFAEDKDYEFHDNYHSGALEYVLPVEETKDKIVLQTPAGNRRQHDYQALAAGLAL